jgi:MFS family permease
LVVIIWLPIYAAQSILELAVAWAILNMIGPSVSSIMFAIVSLNLPADKRASVLSMIYLPMNLAFIIGPLAASVVARNLEVRDVFLGSSALALVALLVLILNLGRTRGEENAATE